MKRDVLIAACPAYMLKTKIAEFMVEHNATGETLLQDVCKNSPGYTPGLSKKAMEKQK